MNLAARERHAPEEILQLFAGPALDANSAHTKHKNARIHSTVAMTSNEQQIVSSAGGEEERRRGGEEERRGNHTHLRCFQYNKQDYAATRHRASRGSGYTVL